MRGTMVIGHANVVDVWLLASVTVNVGLKLPLTVGVPDTTPPLSVIPPGRALDVMVNGGVPHRTSAVTLMDVIRTPTSSVGNVGHVSVGAWRIVSEHVVWFLPPKLSVTTTTNGHVQSHVPVHGHPCVGVPLSNPVEPSVIPPGSCELVENVTGGLPPTDGNWYEYATPTAPFVTDGHTGAVGPAPTINWHVTLLTTPSPSVITTVYDTEPVEVPNGGVTVTRPVVALMVT